MNAQQEAVAYWKFCESRGLKPSIRKTIEHLRDYGMKVDNTAAGAWLKEFSALAAHPMCRVKHKSSTIQAPLALDESQAAHLRAHDNVSLVSKPETPETSSPTSLPPTFFEAKPAPAPPSQPVKSKKPVLIISAYVGAKLEDFGKFEPQVSEVLAADGHGTVTKAFATSLETLAMWRAVYGDDALAYGLGEAADRRRGHRYVGPCAKNYDPDRVALRSIDGGRRYESDSDRAAREFIEGLPRGCDLPDDPDFKPRPQPWDLNRPAGLVALIAANAARQ